MKRLFALLVSAIGLTAYLVWRGHAEPARVQPVADEQDEPVAVLPVSSPPPAIEAREQAPPSTPPSATPSVVKESDGALALDEPATMRLLRDLGDSAPTVTLAVAREANRRFPNSVDAAERGFYVCKSLVNLERFHEARDEARFMVERFRGTPWAADVERHLLVNPLDLPEGAQ